MEAAFVQTNSPVIRMEGVVFGSLRDVSLVVGEEINWVVQSGDFWVVAGLQGAGKSDFLMLTGGLMPPAAGEYWFCGEKMPIFEDARLRERLRLGLVFEGGRLFTQLTVRENVALPLRYHRNLTPAHADAEVQAMLEATELTPFAESTPGVLGRNWQKRVGLARALMLKPELLLVDNPLAGLDLRHANWWLGFLGQLSKGEGPAHGRPMTLVVTAADLRSWKGRARQFALLEKRGFRILGTWTQLETARDELVLELLATETQTG
jgi:ABC-type transporter Mla maintaining outer membrane lipid asymmetry ATPase subunit MlaF